MRPSSGPADKCDCDERFSCLFREHVGRVHAYAFRRLRSPEDAEDLVAEVFLAAWREADNLPREPLYWLLAVAHRRLVDTWRLARRHQQVILRLEQEIAVEPAAESSASTDAVAESPVFAVLATLNESDRETLTLFYWDGLSGQEAAEATGLSPIAFRMRLVRARRRLMRETGNQLGT